MANFYILTNNPLVAQTYEAVSFFRAEAVSGIFTAARDAIHMGARLISHPLAGSLKPNENPYKSIVLANPVGSQLDYDALELIENAAALLRRLPEKNRAYSPAVLEDFQVIDLDLMNSAMAALPAGYHT